MKPISGWGKAEMLKAVGESRKWKAESRNWMEQCGYAQMARLRRQNAEKHPTTNIEHPTSNGLEGARAPGGKAETLNLEPRTSNLEPRTANPEPRTLNLEP
jgi:hypothetical protein